MMLSIFVSIHAPARGATEDLLDYAAEQAGFNPRAREGRDCIFTEIRHPTRSFNPRAREGRDQKMY